MKGCFECGNCKQEGSIYFCPAKNDFVIKETQPVTVKTKRSGWKKGSPDYEGRRRRSRQERDAVQNY